MKTFILDRGVMMTLIGGVQLDPLCSLWGMWEQERHSDAGVDTELTPSAVNFVWKRRYISTDLPIVQDRNETLFSESHWINTQAPLPASSSSV